MSYSNKIRQRYHIGQFGDFPTIQAAIAWLSTGSNMVGNSELFLEAQTFDVPDTISINLNYHLSIRSYDLGSCKIQAATGLTNKPMFNLTSSVWFERVSFYGGSLANYGTLATENCVIISGTQYHEITAMEMKNFYDGIKMTGNAQLWVFNSFFENMEGKGIRIYADGATSLDCEVNTFINCNSCIGLDKSSAGEWHILTNLFQNGDASQVCVTYDPANYTYTDDPVGAQNTWNNIGTFSGGFDYSRADGRDANIFVIGNSGREDKQPHFKVNVIGNTTATTITTAGTFYPAAFTNGDSYTCKYTLENNKYTHQPRNIGDATIWIMGNLSVNGTNRTVTVTLRKNGVTTNISPVTTRCAVSGQPYFFGITAYISTMAATDFFEIYVTSSTNGDLVTLEDFTIYLAER